MAQRPVASNLTSELPLAGDVDHLSPLPVLDPRLPGLVVLVDQRDPVAGTQAVVDAGDLELDVAELAAGVAVVLGACVELVDLLVRGVGDQHDLVDGECAGESLPSRGRRARLLARACR